MAKVQILQYPLPGSDGSGEDTRSDKIFVSFIPVRMKPGDAMIKNLEKSSTAWKAPYETKTQTSENGEDTLDAVVDAGTFFDFTIPDTDKILIQLALPSSSINDSFSSSWDFQTLDLAEQALERGADKLGSSSKGALLGATAKAGVKLAGKIAPPILLTQYQSTESRKFTWNFQMIPQSKAEAIVCQNIIFQFKRWSSPGHLGLQDFLNIEPFILIPKITTADGGSCPLAEMLKLFPCVIEDFSVSYFDNGQIVTYKDGMPKSIQISLTTREMLIHTRQSLGANSFPAGGY